MKPIFILFFSILLGLNFCFSQNKVEVGGFVLEAISSSSLLLTEPKYDQDLALEIWGKEDWVRYLKFEKIANPISKPEASNHTLCENLIPRARYRFLSNGRLSPGKTTSIEVNPGVYIIVITLKDTISGVVERHQKTLNTDPDNYLDLQDDGFSIKYMSRE